VRGQLEFAGAFAAGRPWADIDRCALRGTSGFEPTAQHTSLALDIVVPSAAAGRRFWVIEFRGIGVVVTFGANDVVQAAIVEGDVHRADRVQRAYARAAAALLDGGKPAVVAGAVHRVTITVEAINARTRAIVRVLFDNLELVKGFAVDLDPNRLPDFAVHPQQDLAVRRVIVRADGL
jgi:hypothetical protein